MLDAITLFTLPLLIIDVIANKALLPYATPLAIRYVILLILRYAIDYYCYY